LEDEVQVIQTGCFGLCAAGAIVEGYPDEVYYSHVKPEDAKELIEEHLLKGRVVDRILFKTGTDEIKRQSFTQTDFYKKQHRIALQNCGNIDPEEIDEYLAFDGYLALQKVLLEMTPQQVIDTMKESGLRGRGGGGFPTGTKWQFAKNAAGEKKYVACNADEGDPGAFMDRSILEGDPHCVIEAMAMRLCNRRG
jgi:(2Fe-2S) ferredoxin